MQTHTRFNIQATGPLSLETGLVADPGEDAFDHLAPLLGVSRGLMGWIVFEVAWIVCPGSADGLVWREAA